MAGVELVSLRWGHQAKEYSTYLKRTVERFKVCETNSAGGADIETEIYNASEKTIKYITFSYVAYNSVGDVISCTIKKKNVVTGRLTGPIGVNETATVVFENMWYNTTISEVKIEEITVQYMDDSIETIAGADLPKVYDYNRQLNKGTVYYEKRGKAEEEAAKKREEEKKKEAEENNKKAKITGVIIAAFFVLMMVIGIASGC